MMHIFLLRGLAREAAHWLEFPQVLRQTLGDNCCLHLLDFPGCGKYYQQPALASIAAMTDHARANAETTSAIASGEPVFIIGISMGGMVALDWAQRYPDELKGVVLINSSSGRHPIWWRLRPRVWPLVVSLLLPWRLRENLVLRAVTNCSAQFQKRLEQWLTIQQQRPVTRAAIIGMLRAAAKFRPQSFCLVNGLVLTSDGDRMVSTHASENLASGLAWPILRHANAGHDLPMDDPQWVANQITAYITAKKHCLS